MGADAHYISGVQQGSSGRLQPIAQGIAELALVNATQIRPNRSIRVPLARRGAALPSLFQWSFTSQDVPSPFYDPVSNVGRRPAKTGLGYYQ